VRIDEVPITPDKVLKALKAEAGTARSAFRQQIVPIEAPSPWPTRLIKWWPEEVNGGGKGEKGDASVPTPLHTTPAPGIIEGEGQVQ